MAHEPSATHHVKDTPSWQFFDRLFGDEGATWHMPRLFTINGHDVYLTKFMVIELFAAALILAIYIPIARRAKNGELPKGRFWNAFESLLTFIRNEVARPNLGAKDADRYVPYLWTLFLFILFNNLLGLIPFLGSPTASVWATGALALCSFVMLHGAAIVQMGLEDPHAHHDDGHGHGEGHHGEHAPEAHHASSPGGIFKVPYLGTILLGLVRYVKALWPRIDVPYVGWLFSGMIFGIELMGSFIKSAVLAVRLFANMFAGHMVLAMILLFIVMAGKGGFSVLWPVVTAGSVFGVAALSLLEIFVAFLQAYIFTFLTALFMGMSLHPEH